ncbi:MAG: M14 family metallopeptidase [Aristaeellaceae bacterium]
MQVIAKAALPVDEVLTIRKQRYGSSGRRISIVTGIHGDELEGQYVCYELARRLQAEPEKLKGIVDIYPAMNPNGLDAWIRGIPAFDLDMNRIFPGRSDGDMNEYIASQIIHDLTGSELCLDIHASNIYLTEIPQIRISEQDSGMLLPYARIANVDFVWVHGASTVLQATLAHSLNSRGTKTLVVEMGVGMRITQRYGLQLVEGILNLMRELGLWLGDAQVTHTPVVSDQLSDVSFLNAACSGVFIKQAEIGDMLQAGQVIGHIVEPMTGRILHEVTSPTDGWLFTVREYPMVSEGSLMGRILSREAYDRKGTEA